jgi:hypothetical protein
MYSNQFIADSLSPPRKPEDIGGTLHPSLKNVERISTRDDRKVSRADLHMPYADPIGRPAFPRFSTTLMEWKSQQQMIETAIL